MYNQWFVNINGLFDWLIFSVALFVISGKLGWQKRWKAWIPGLRMYCLGQSVELGREGMYCGILDLLFVMAGIFRFEAGEGQFGILAALLHLILFLFLFIYRIRIFLQILKLFGLGKQWLILWLLVDWLPLLILGIGKKYQPVKENLREGAARIPNTEQAAARPRELLNNVVPLAQEGLSIHIRERVVKDFGKKHCLLRDIALNIPDHSLVLLLGGSGAGKTTLINAVTGYEKADGTILLHGVDVYKDYESVKHKIGFVPQKNLIRAQDTVKRTVGDIAAMRLPKSVSKEDRNRMVEDNMDLLGLSAGQNGLVSKKSGGQLRRICIAMELVTDPALFILDEPDSGLDGVISREIFTKLRRIADDGRIVIVITHTPDRVIDLFDRVIVLAKDSAGTGRLAFYGSPGEAREFFEKDTMEQIVMSVNSREEGGEGRADELIEKYAAYAAAKKGGQTS